MSVKYTAVQMANPRDIDAEKNGMPVLRAYHKTPSPP